MELKLKDENETKRTNENPDMDLDDSYISGEGNFGEGNFGPYVNNPVRISTVVEAPSAGKRISGYGVFAIARWMMILAAIAGAVFFIMKVVNPEAKDVTNLVNMDVEEVERTLDVTLNENSSMISQIYQYSDGNVTVYGNGEIGVVYIDDLYVGLHINDKKYSLYGVKIGDSETTAEANMTFASDESMVVLNDITKGNSTTVFYINKVKGDCFAVIYNDHSNRAVAMTYFKNCAKVTENLQSIGDED